MGTRVSEGANWQAEPAIGEGSRQEGASVIRLTVKTVHFHSDSDAIDAHRTESFLVQGQGGRIR
jgi:hypothetical protein